MPLPLIPGKIITVYSAVKNSLLPLFVAVSALTQVKVNPPAGFDVGVKWQIEIQNTVDITKPLNPTDALVWDVDLYHVARNPGIIDYLRVSAGRVLVLDLRL